MIAVAFIIVGSGLIGIKFGASVGWGIFLVAAGVTWFNG